MKSILTAFVCFLTVAVNGQHYNFLSYTVEDGLAQSQVTDICQDDYGYLWIGTVSGLSRFDGVSFKNYSIDEGLPDNNIKKLYLSNAGDLWVATASGIVNFHNQNPKKYLFEETYRITDIAELKGKIYFSSRTGLLEFKDETFIPLGNEMEREYYFRSVATYKDSILLCGSKEGIQSWDGSVFNRFEIPGFDSLNIRNLTIVSNKLYVSARKVGLLSYDFSSGETVVFDLPFTSVSAVHVDDEEIFGITLNAGAFLIRGGDTLIFNDRNGLMKSGIDCVFKDNEGNIWLGTDGRSGLMKFSGTSVVSYSTEDNLASKLVLSIVQDENGNFTFGTYDKGITQFKRNEIINLDKNNGNLKDNTVWSLLEVNGNIWVGTSRGLTVIDSNSMVVNTSTEVSTKIRTMVEVDGEGVFIGGDEGLFQIHDDTIVNLHADLNVSKLYALNEKLYCAAKNGFFELDQKNDYSTYQQIDLPEKNTSSITSDFNNNLWVGTANGLFVILNNGHVHRFILDRQNPQSKQVDGLIASSDSSIWVSGKNGVYQIDYNPEVKNNFNIYNYSQSEGLVGEETNINALYEDDEGFIWVGTANGLARIDPAANKQLFDYQPPKLRVTGVRLFMEDFKYGDYATQLDSVFNVPIQLEFPYNKNHVTFDFIGINLKDPTSVQYEYRLIGTNEQWSPISSSNYAAYSFLQPGEYTFQVRASSKNRDWSSVQEINVIIQPPFWKTWWFLSLCILGVFLIVLFIFQSRIGALKQKQENEKLDLKNRLLFLEQRSLNASMNRHFIFNSLNSIQYFINSSDRLSANRFLSNFAKLIRKNLDSSAANNFIVTLQEEIERIELYLSLEKMRFSDKFEYKVRVSSSIDTESIEIPSMILQPFVENSIIHGVLSLDRLGKIEVNVYQEFGEVVFEVIDNGMGIDNSLKLKKNQIEGDHESKGVEITNRRIELLRRLTGENMLIVGPFQMNDEKENCLGTKVILKLGGTEKFES